MSAAPHRPPGLPRCVFIKVQKQPPAGRNLHSHEIWGGGGESRAGSGIQLPVRGAARRIWWGRQSAADTPADPPCRPPGSPGLSPGLSPGRQSTGSCSNIINRRTSRRLQELMISFSGPSVVWPVSRTDRGRRGCAGEAPSSSEGVLGVRGEGSHGGLSSSLGPG